MKRQLSQSYEDNILANGALDSRDFYDWHPIQEGMDTLLDDQPTDGP